MKPVIQEEFNEEQSRGLRNTLSQVSTQQMSLCCPNFSPKVSLFPDNDPKLTLFASVETGLI